MSEPKKVIRTKKTKKATSEVEVVGDEEVPPDGTVNGTQKSDVVASKSKPKRSTRPKKKDVISPVVEENEVDVEAGNNEEAQSEKAVEDETPTMDADVSVVGEELQVRKRRHLRKAISTEFAAAGDSEETQSDEDVLIERLATCHALPRVDRREEEESEEKEKGYVGPSASGRRYRRRSLFYPKRLGVPLSYMTSLLTGDILFAVVGTDDRRCRKIDRLIGENFALEQEVKELKFECDNAFEISSQMKEDVDMVMEENQTLENENKELKTALEGEENKVQTLEDTVKELQMVLEREKERQSKKNDELVASYMKYHDLLRRKMDLDTSLNERKRESEKL
ncbi:hypothetical protein Dimus_013564 [Dionaea muscipula]